MRIMITLTTMLDAPWLESLEGLQAPRFQELLAANHTRWLDGAAMRVAEIRRPSPPVCAVAGCTSSPRWRPIAVFRPYLGHVGEPAAAPLRVLLCDSHRAEEELGPAGGL